MDAATAQVLFDVATITVGALVLGLLVFLVVRRRDTEVGWQYHGNVWTSPIDRIDLMAAVLLLAYYYLNVVAPLFLSDQMTEAGQASTAISPMVLMAVNMVFTLGLGAGVFAFFTFLRKRDPIQMFGLDRLSPGMILAWATGGVVVVYIAVAAVQLLIWEPFFKEPWGDEGLQQIVKMLGDADNPGLKAIIVLTAVVVAPLVEEVIFRGVIYTSLKRYSDRFFAAIITSSMFAVVHGTVPGLLPLFALAILLTVAYEITGCLWVPMAMHAIFNGINTYFILNHPAG